MIICTDFGICNGDEPQSRRLGELLLSRRTVGLAHRVREAGQRRVVGSVLLDQGLERRQAIARPLRVARAGDVEADRAGLLARQHLLAAQQAGQPLPGTKVGPRQRDQGLTLIHVLTVTIIHLGI